jgi:hypothetical protein
MSFVAKVLEGIEDAMSLTSQDDTTTADDDQEGCISYEYSSRVKINESIALHNKHCLEMSFTHTLVSSAFETAGKIAREEDHFVISYYPIIVQVEEMSHDDCPISSFRTLPFNSYHDDSFD